MVVVKEEKKTHSSLSSQSKATNFHNKIFNSRIFILSALFLIPISYLVFQVLQQNPSFLSATTRLFTTTSKEQTPEMASSNEVDWKNAKTIYDFSAKDIDGNQLDLNKFKGRVVLIVNVACNCGFTNSNYPQMQDLHRKYEKDGLSVLAFPSNQFGGQEPKPESEIKEFVKEKFDVEFCMFSKINVNGDNAHPLYKFLKSKLGGTLGDFIKWNFSKFLIDRNGVPFKRYAPTVAPKEIEDDIVKLLNAKPESS